MVFKTDKFLEVERHLVQRLQESKDGLSTKEVTEQTPTLAPDERAALVNKLLQSGDIEMLSVEGSNSMVLRYRKSNLPAGASAEDQLIYSLIEGADKSGIWVRDIREQSGLTEPIIRRTLKGLEQRKLIKAIKGVGTAKKTYILYNVDADENLTGGIFYSDQEFDSQFVQTLVQVCVSMLQSRRKEAVEKFPHDKRAQLDFASVKSDYVAQFIHDRGVSKVQLSITDVENILNVAVIDGNIEKRMNNTYRGLNQTIFKSPLLSMPCYSCPMQSECSTGHRISPENCEYIRNAFDL